MRKRVTKGGAHLRGTASEHHGTEETLQWWRTVGDTVSNSISLGIERKLKNNNNYSRQSSYLRRGLYEHSARKH